jgi:hypothetical protein
MAAAAVLEPADDLLDSSLLLVVVVCLLAMVGCWVWLGAPLDSKASRGRERVTRKQAPMRVAVVAPAQALSPRVIPLYSSTPGQSRYQYNIGDSRGTRGTS